jgi:hypothetical protein
MRASIRGVTLALVLSLGLVAPAQAEPGAMSQFGTGALTVGANLLYMPCKLIYAMGGGLAAGIGYVFSGGDSDVVAPIVDASLRGDYVVTPENIRGKEPLQFIGRSPEQQRAEEWSY